MLVLECLGPCVLWLHEANGAQRTGVTSFVQGARREMLFGSHSFGVCNFYVRTDFLVILKALELSPDEVFGSLGGRAACS